ncbi:MAG: DUF3794 domain-containing protein [Peptostreptococcaceae bacterium]
MACKCNNRKTATCDCDFNVNVFGLCDATKVKFTNSTSPNFKKDYNWTEISIPEILCIPPQKPDVEHVDQVFVSVDITCVKLIETPKYLATVDNAGVLEYDLDADGFPIPLPNDEGTYLTGRKIIVDGILKQKVVYTGEVTSQSVHSAHFEIPFSAFIIAYPKFEDDEVVVSDAIVDLEEQFCVDVCVEDVFIKRLDPRTLFKNVTLFLKAKPKPSC